MARFDRGKILMLLWMAMGGVFAVQTNAATIVYVNQAASIPGTGADWANAFTDLQTALAAADGVVAEGDDAEVWVAAGVYKPTPNSIDRSASFHLRNRVAVYGGFAGTETTREERDPSANVTVLSGDIDSDDDTADPSRCDADELRGANSYHVVVASGTDGTALLDGFVITAGDASGGDGGGIFIRDGAPVLRNLTICGNSAGSWGGGARIERSLLPPYRQSLENVTISGNQARFGGGLSTEELSLQLTSVAILNNRALRGGGLYDECSVLTVTNGKIIGNSVVKDSSGYRGDGGGILSTAGPYCVGALTLSNVLISSNYAESCCAGVWVSGNRAAAVNVTAVGNQLTGETEYRGGDAFTISSWSLPPYFNWQGSLDLWNSIIWNNGETPEDDIAAGANSLLQINYSDVQMPEESGAPWPGAGNINADPLFVSSSDFRLQPGSPAIDAGISTVVYHTYYEYPPDDLDGNPRIIGAEIDMGPYEYEPPLTVSAEAKHVTCHGGNDGAVDLTVSGGTGVYGITWSPGGQTTEDLSGLVAGTYTATIRDSNGCEQTKQVTITQPALPVLTLTVAPLGISPATPTVQYSDRLRLEATVDPPLDGTIVYTLRFASTGAVVQELGDAAVVAGVAKTLTPQVLAATLGRDSRYSVHAVFTSAAGCSGVSTKSTLVHPEDATITPHPQNGSAFTQDEANAGFVLRFSVRETSPEPKGDPPGVAPGDINQTGLIVSLTPVGGGDPLVAVCAAESPVAAFEYVSRNFTCSFSGVPVDAYEVTAGLRWSSVEHNRYYAAPYVEALTVYDPAAGFVTGGGTFVYPSSEDRVNFGLVYRFTGKDKTTPRGNLLVIRHMDNGDICRAKSNGIGAPAVSANAAAFSGKGQYVCVQPDGTIYAEAGNLGFTGWVEDNEVTGAPDRFWIRVPETALSMAKPATEHARPLTGGNIQVPHKRK